MRYLKYFYSGVLLLPLAIGVYSSAETIPFDSERWQLNGQDTQIEEYLGQQSLKVTNGSAIVTDSAFTNGIIEYDVALGQGRGFAGAMWRLQDLNNYEHFYMRPHQSGNPDATQYTPTFNGMSGWQLYYGDGYSSAFQYTFNEWMHVKIVVAGQNAEVYINDMDEPVLVAKELKREIQSGKVALSSNALPPTFTPTYFANFSYTDEDNPPLKGVPEPETAQPGTIMSWLVSNSFDGTSLENKFVLSEVDRQNLLWTELASEASGRTNLAKIQGVAEGQNTVFARITIVSDQEQIKQLQYGFSDSVKVYFNGNLIEGGNDTFQSRDYRFLGTMGFFDVVYLPLKTGENELWMAISEGFGGWGVQARFKDLDGITLATTGGVDLNTVPTGESCATYSPETEKVHIPCVSVGGSTYEVEMQQQPPNLIFEVDQNSIKPR